MIFFLNKVFTWSWLGKYRINIPRIPPAAMPTATSSTPRSTLYRVEPISQKKNMVNKPYTDLHSNHDLDLWGWFQDSVCFKLLGAKEFRREHMGLKELDGATFLLWKFMPRKCTREVRERATARTLPNPVKFQSIMLGIQSPDLAAVREKCSLKVIVTHNSELTMLH